MHRDDQKKGYVQVLRVTQAGRELAVGVSGGGVVPAANTIEDVLAVVSSVGSLGVTSLQAEQVVTHEATKRNSGLEPKG